MKKLFSLALALCLLLTTTACGGGGTPASGGAASPSGAQSSDASDASDPSGAGSGQAGGASSTPDETPDDSTPAGSQDTSAPTDTPDASHILVAYFSLAGEQYEVGIIEKGNTEIVAEMIAEATGAETFRLESTTSYPDTYNGLLEVSRQEESDPPELTAEPQNLENKDVVFLGYPIWWGDLPTILRVFLESQDLAGKTIVPFCTNGGSGLANTEAAIRQLCPDSTVADGLAIRGSDAQNDPEGVRTKVLDWLTTGGYL